MKLMGICGLVLVQALGGALCACGSGAEGGVGAEQDSSSVGEVNLALAQVPTGVQCIQVTVASGATTLTTQTFAASGSGWTGTVPLGTFNKGTVTVTANAYSAVCSAIAGTTASWVADAVSVDLTPGRPGAITLNFRQNFGVVATGNFAPSVVDISLGYSTTGLVLADGTVRLIGSVATPTGLTSVAELAVGFSHACARKNDGSMWCWGDNANGQLGTGGTVASPTTPVQPSGMIGVTNIGAGEFDSCATVSGMYDYCWGWNNYGQFRDGTTTQRNSPIGTGTEAVSQWGLAKNVCVINSWTLTVACSGDNSRGALGSGDTAVHTAGVLAFSNAATSVGVGRDHACASDTQGRVFCWGANDWGQLGLGTVTSALLAVQVGGALSGVTVAEVTAGSYATCARSTTGNVYCWGDNVNGAVGDGTNVPRLAPVQVLSGSKKIRGAGFHFCSLQLDDSVQCWGENESGQLGDGTHTSSTKPIPMKL